MTRRDDPDAADDPAAFVFRPEYGDPNRMGALLEGRLRGKDRDEALAEIAASDEAVEVFADAAVILHEHELEDRAAAYGGSHMAPKPAPLSRLESAALRYITKYLAENTFQPSFREIGQHLGLKSTKQVSELLQSLESKGHVERVDQQSRSVRLLHVRLLPPVTALPVHPASPPGDLPAELLVDRRLIPSRTACYFVVGSAADSTLTPGDVVIVEPTTELVPGEELLVQLSADGACAVRRLHSPDELAPGELMHGRVLALLRRPASPQASRRK